MTNVINNEPWPSCIGYVIIGKQKYIPQCKLCDVLLDNCKLMEHLDSECHKYFNTEKMDNFSRKKEIASSKSECNNDVSNLLDTDIKTIWNTKFQSDEKFILYSNILYKYSCLLAKPLINSIKKELSERINKSITSGKEINEKTKNNNSVLKMTDRSKSRKGLGIGGAKRHRNVLKVNIKCLTNAAIRRLARRGGVKRISGLVYEHTRAYLNCFLENVIRDAITYTEHAERKIVTAMDVVYALKRRYKLNLLCTDLYKKKLYQRTRSPLKCF